MFEQVKEILINELGVNADDVTMDAEFVSDLGLNSLELMNLVVIFEETFDITIKESDLHRLITVGDIVGYISDLSKV